MGDRAYRTLSGGLLGQIAVLVSVYAANKRARKGKPPERVGRKATDPLLADRRAAEWEQQSLLVASRLALKKMQSMEVKFC